MTREQLIKAFEEKIHKSVFKSEHILLVDTEINQLATALVDSIGIDEDKVEDCFKVLAEKQMREAIKRTNKEGFSWSTEGWSLSHSEIAKAISTSDILTVKEGK